MKILSTPLARVIAVLPGDEIDPKGVLDPAKLIAGIAQKLGFAKYPTTNAELTNAGWPGKLVDILDGSFENILIDKISVSPNLLSVDTRSSTKNSETIVNEVFSFLSSSLGVDLPTLQRSRRLYVTNLVFESEGILSRLIRTSELIGNSITPRIQERFKVNFPYVPISIKFGHDPLDSKLVLQQFTIERRKDIAFSENRYFSSSPLRSEEHADLLQEIDRASQ